MNISVKLPKVRNDDIYGLRKFSHDIELSNVRSLSSLVNQELEAREAFPLNAVEDGKNGSNSYEEFPYTGSSFHINCYRCQKLANI